METTKLIYDNEAKHGAGRGWTVRSRETLKALAVRASQEVTTDHGLYTLLVDRSEKIKETFNKTEGVPVEVSIQRESITLEGLGRRPITLWSESGSGIAGYLKWKSEAIDLLDGIFE